MDGNFACDSARDPEIRALLLKHMSLNGESRNIILGEFLSSARPHIDKQVCEITPLFGQKSALILS